MPDSPTVVILAGPNGAGKSTAAASLVRDALGLRDFVNADVIAQGLSGFAPNSVALLAGRVMLERLHSLARDGRSFAFESTLASRTLAPWIAQLRTAGYSVYTMFLALPSPALACARVALRVQAGGHAVDPEVVHRRFDNGLRNFFRLFIPLSDRWRLYDASLESGLIIAHGCSGRRRTVRRPELWNDLALRYGP